MIRLVLWALAILIQAAFFLASLAGIYVTVRIGLYWIGPLTLVFWIGALVFVVAAFMLARNILWLVRGG